MPFDLIIRSKYVTLKSHSTLIGTIIPHVILPHPIQDVDRQILNDLHDKLRVLCWLKILKVTVAIKGFWSN